MNRLWVQLSITYVVTTLLIMGLIVLFILQIASRPDFTAVNVASISDADRLLLRELGQSGALLAVFRGMFSAQITVLLIIVTIAALLASVYASWRLTRPLTMLVEATDKVGKRELAYRVNATGSREMQELAQAFNEMVRVLESAETRRQNLLADVSHELRTPLTVLQGNLRAALDEIAPLEPQQIAKLYDQTRQLNHLIQDLHDLAQAEANRLTLEMMPLDLCELVRQVGDIFAPLAEADGIALTVECSTPVDLRGDRTRLMQVLQNLIANALRYAESEVVLSVRRVGELVEVKIVDDGGGISAEYLPHIFDRFYRADNSRSRETGGTGLGLAIVKSIVEAHGGTITVVSAIGRGTTFTLRF